MGNNDVYEFARRMVQKNPKLANSPEGREFLQLLETRDDKNGVALARQLLTNAKLTPTDGLQMATNFFGLNE